MARRYQVALIPPTELLLIMLDRNDKAFVLREFPDRIRDISALSTYRFWFKIIHVEVFVHITPTPNLDPTAESKSQRTDIFLVDMSSDCVPVVLSLYDNQTKLASIFRRNDYIGLYKPALKQSTASQEIAFEYACDTAIFLMPEKEAQEASLAKVNLTTLASQDDAFSYTDPKKDIAERDEEVTTNNIFHDFCKSILCKFLGLYGLLKLHAANLSSRFGPSYAECDPIGEDCWFSK